MWMSDIAKTLRSALGSNADKVPTRIMPTFVVRILALFVAQVRMIAPLVGVRNELTTGKARRVLGFSPRPATEAVIACAESLLRLGL